MNAGTHQSRRILVVDDEPALAEIACRWLVALGHEPVAAHGPVEALERIGPDIHTLFTDVVMPGPMDGLGLAREAKRRHPGIRVLLTSGYSRSVVDDPGELPGPLLNKPYRRDDLARALASLWAMP